MLCIPLAALIHFFDEFGPLMNSASGPPSQEDIDALLKKHGMSLVGPPLTKD